MCSPCSKFGCSGTRICITCSFFARALSWHEYRVWLQIMRHRRPRPSYCSLSSKPYVCFYLHYRGPGVKCAFGKWFACVGSDKILSKYNISYRTGRKRRQTTIPFMYMLETLNFIVGVCLQLKVGVVPRRSRHLAISMAAMQKRRLLSGKLYRFTQEWEVFL